MTRIHPLITLALVAACNVGDAPGSGTSTAAPDAGQQRLPTGAGEVEGTIDGNGLSTVRSAFYFDLDGQFAIALSERGAACQSIGELGNVLVFPIACGGVTAGRYDIVTDIETVDCAFGARALQAFLEGSDGEDLGSASSGEVTIESVTAESVIGEFRIRSVTDSMTGRFNAVSCN